MSKIWKGLSGVEIKYIAMVCMLTDHIAAGIFGPMIVNGCTKLVRWYDFMRSVGRLAFPLYCLLAAEGVGHSKHRKQYVLSLWLFAFLSEIPFDLVASGNFIYPADQNIYFMLAAAVTAYFIAERKRGFGKLFPYAAAALFAHMIHSDYGAFGILMLFLYFSGRNAAQYLAGSAEIAKGLCVLFRNSYLQIPSILAVGCVYLFLLDSYNGKRGRSRLKNKYAFYAFYPLHLFAIGLIRKFVLHR